MKEVRRKFRCMEFANKYVRVRIKKMTQNVWNASTLSCLAVL
jgi:hypothetical protein